jgi:hypothetical protein
MALWMVKPERRVVELLASQIDADQARGRDLLEHQAVGVDQELVLGARHARGDVGEDEIVPAEQGHQPIGSGQVDAGAPFIFAHTPLQGGNIVDRGRLLHHLSPG